jgi:hypothetical protein
MTMTHASLFSGIGGFDLAAEWAGWTNSFNCEIDPFCRKILKYHFPDAEQYGDIRTADFAVWRDRIDVLTGGFPCQPFSLAGKRKGNPEQIALLQKIERERTQREKDANDGRLDVYIHVEDIKYKVVCEFTCICGNKIQARGINYTDVWEDLECPVYEDGPIICDKCYREYEIDGLHAKLIKR